MFSTTNYAPGESVEILAWDGDHSTFPEFNGEWTPATYVSRFAPPTTKTAKTAHVVLFHDREQVVSEYHLRQVIR